MTNEELCRTCKRRFAPEDQSDCWFCMDNNLYAPDKPIKAIKKRMTNYEHIKSLSIEDMATEFVQFGCNNMHCNPMLSCKECWIGWLNLEVLP